MIHISKDQHRDLTQGMFYAKVYRFLRRALPASYLTQVGSLDDVTALWASVPWEEGATEHDLAVYLTFVWLASFDDEAAWRLRLPSEALASREAVLAMKCYMVDAGLFDMCAFDRA